MPLEYLALVGHVTDLTPVTCLPGLVICHPGHLTPVVYVTRLLDYLFVPARTPTINTIGTVKSCDSHIILAIAIMSGMSCGVKVH